MKKLNKYFLFVFILIILKQVLMSHIPIIALTIAGCDDQLMVKLAANILQMNYLGVYDCLTFVKGISFPLFLSVNTALGISYINAITLLYSISVFLFVESIKKLLPKDWMKYVLFAVLLFNPIMYSQEVVQRVYRNSLIPSQVLLIFSSFFSLYLNRKEKNKKILPWSILGGISLLFFYNTREDSIWIMPFVLTCTIILIVNNIIVKKNYKKIIIFLLPLLFLTIGNIGIKCMNYIHYGTYVRIDEENSAFSNAMKTIYSVKDEKNQKWVSVSRDKIKKLYEVSPTLNNIQRDLDYYMDTYAIIDRTVDNEVEDGWFWWSFRFAVQESGYYETPKKAEDFYNNVTREINNAIKDGKLEKISTMPSALMSPWKKGYGLKLLDTINKEIIYTNSFKDLKLSLVESDGIDRNISYFESLTNDQAIYPTSENNLEANIHKKKVLNVYIGKLNIISNIYRIAPILSIVALISYIVLTIKLIKNKTLIDKWLIVTSILLSYIVLLIGVGYNHISSCHSITYMYLCATYPLILMFDMLNIMFIKIKQ